MERNKIKVSDKSIKYIIIAVRDWDKQFIDYIELKEKIKDVIYWTL